MHARAHATDELRRCAARRSDAGAHARRSRAELNEDGLRVVAVAVKELPPGTERLLASPTRSS